MDHNPMLFLALANGPSFIAVVIGILINDYQMRNLNSRMAALVTHPVAADARLGDVKK